MSVINSTPLIAAGDDGYTISRSVRFRASATAYLTKTYGTPTNNKVWTWSAWVKRGSLSLADANHLFMGSAQDIGSNPTTYSRLVFETDHTLRLQSNSSAGEAFTSNALYRDTSAWYHIVLSMNAASTVVNCYVNGVEISYASRTNPSNTNTAINGSGNYHRMGLMRTAEPRSFDGYMTEVNFIDGQALTPSSFGETDTITGVWKPKRYAGTYGTNGFYLNFSDNSNNTAATLGKDSSGNGNNWTPNNISVTSGVTYDSMLDTPTPYADGGNGRGNYATLNPLDATGNATLSAANLRGTTSGVNGKKATIAVSSGKYYWEGTCVSGDYSGIGCRFGIDSVVTPVASGARPGSTATSYVYTSWNGSKVNNNTSTSYGNTYTTNNVISVALDLDNGKIWWAKDGVWQASGDPAAGTNAAFTGVSGTYTAVFGDDTGGGIVIDFNFGQRPFAYTPPTGFKALNTQNLPDATIKKGSKYFDVRTRSGTGATYSVTGLEFAPDLVWFKCRSTAYDNNLQDTVRGATNTLSSNQTDAEISRSGSVTAFNSDGYTGGSFIGLNASGSTYVDWMWKESVSAGFDIVTYTGTGSAQNISHNLGVKPSLIIIKQRSASGQDWGVYHSSIGATKYLSLNGTSEALTTSVPWNNTEPTSSVFTVNTWAAVNASTATYVAYCFSEVAGYSKFGSYVGNGSSEGVFVYLGFKARFLLIKNITAAQGWIIVDTARNTYNVAGDYLSPNSGGVENYGSSRTTATNCDILSNGFKLRNDASSSGYTNASSQTYIYAAFAENPFKNSLAR